MNSNFFKIRCFRIAFRRKKTAAETASIWINFNRCIPPPVISEEPDIDPLDGNIVHKSLYNT